MEDTELKSKVLEGMMEFMDELEGEKLKSHPRLMAAKMEVKPKEEIEVESEEEVDPEMLQKLMEMLKEE